MTLNQKGIVLPPALVWTVVIVGSILIVQDAVKQGYISIDSPYISKETFPPQPTKFSTPLPTYEPSPTSTLKFVSPKAQQPAVVLTPISTKQPPPVLNEKGNILNLINDYRKQSGLYQLRISEELCRVAKYRANLILTEDPKLEKSSIGNHYKFDEIFNLYSGNGVAENVHTHKGRIDALQLIEDWKSSPGHNRLMVTTEFPFGCVETETNGNYNAVVLLVGDK